MGGSRRSGGRLLSGEADLAGNQSSRQAGEYELGNFALRAAGKRALGGEPRFERQLRGETIVHRLVGRRLSGFVIYNADSAVGQTIDTVGSGGEGELPAIDVQDGAALAFAVLGLRACAPFALLLDEPMRDALKLRPPESLNLGLVEPWREELAANGEQPVESIVAERAWTCLREVAQGVVHKTAAVGRRERFGQRIERLKGQHFFRIEEIGIGNELLDASNAQALRAGGERRRGPGLARCNFSWPVIESRRQALPA